MKQRTYSIVSTIAVLLLSSGLSLAIENKMETSLEASIKVDASQKSAKSEVDAKHKQTVKIRLVDINSARKEELMKLPGVSADEADKIIAGRPFGSKAWLVTNKILPDLTYQAVKGKIICKLSKKDIDKIMAQSTHKDKK